MRGGNGNAYGCVDTGCDGYQTVWELSINYGDGQVSIEYFDSEAQARAAQAVARSTPDSGADHPSKRPLSDYEKQQLSPYLPKADLDRAVIHIGQTPRYHKIPFPFPENADAVTVNNDIYIRKGKYDPSKPEGLALLAHELFHVDQYRIKTMTVWSYLREAKSHGTYMENKFEEPAYRFGDAVLEHLTSHGTRWDGSLIP